MKSILRPFRHGQRGFTLIELLVVIAILGILAAVVIPNVMGMMGSGTVQAANTEAHNVEIGVLAAMVDNDVYELDAIGTVGPATDIIVGTGTEPATVKDYITGALQAVYTIGTDGHITGAVPDPDPGSKWAGLVYEQNVGWAEATIPAG